MRPRNGNERLFTRLRQVGHRYRRGQENQIRRCQGACDLRCQGDALCDIDDETGRKSLAEIRLEDGIAEYCPMDIFHTGDVRCAVKETI